VPEQPFYRFCSHTINLSGRANTIDGARNEEFHHDLWMICRTARAIIFFLDTFKVYTFYYILYKSTNVVFFD
jgi:hypothetical protein